jgi:hypothetical protein
VYPRPPLPPRNQPSVSLPHLAHQDVTKNRYVEAVPVDTTTGSFWI